MSPAVPFQPGTPTMTARGLSCAGPHVRYINWRPSEADHAGGPSLHSEGPGGRTTGFSLGAHAAKATPIASARIRVAARSIEGEKAPASAVVSNLEFESKGRIFLFAEAYGVLRKIQDYMHRSIAAMRLTHPQNNSGPDDSGFATSCKTCRGRRGFR